MKKEYKTIDHLCKSVKDPKSLFQYLKWNKYLQTDLQNKTKQLDGCYMAQPLSQRLYHFINNISDIPTVDTGWYCKYKNISQGYILDKLQDVKNCEWYKLNDAELFLYFKSTTTGVWNKFLIDWVNKQTPFLDEFNGSVSQRVFHIKHELSFPLVNFMTGKLGSRAMMNNVEKIKNTINKFLKLDEPSKIEWIKKWTTLKYYQKTVYTKNIAVCFPIVNYILDKTKHLKSLKGCKNLNLLAYHIINNGADVPFCAHCTKQLRWSQFNIQLNSYPMTCSRICNNSFRANIEKRLINNSTNKNGYKTNVGKNEVYLLKKIEKLKKLQLEYNGRIGSYFVDGVDKNKKVVVEIQEKHHAYTKQKQKDFNKIKYLLQNNYKVILVLDGWFNSKTKFSKFQKKYLEEMSQISGVTVIGNVLNPINGQVLSSSGWSNFLGTKKTKSNKSSVCIDTDNNKHITVTEDHLVFYTDSLCKPAREFIVGESILTNIGLAKIKKIEKKISETAEWFDVVETDDNTFFANGIKVHNCLAIDEAAFIEPHLLEEFWSSVIPSISSGKKSKILMVSTPNGIGNKFYEIYSGAEKGTIKGWKHERVDWWEVPDHDEQWKADMIAALGSEEKFNQEFGNQFLDDAAAAVGASVIEKFKRERKDPIWISQDEEYIVFEYPKFGNLYVIGVDVGEGIGRAASVAQVLDVTNLLDIKQVAVYGSSTIEPFHFANKLNTIGSSWGNAPMLIERNNCGAQVIDALYYKHQYEKIVSYSKISEKDQYNRTRNMGVLSHTNIKFDGIQNMRYWVNHLEVVSVNDPTTISEFETFVRQPNGIFKKRSDNFFDDRIMALVWATFILEPEICEQYFTIAEYDNQHKPLKITSNGYWEDRPDMYELKTLDLENSTTIHNPNPSDVPYEPPFSLKFTPEEQAKYDKYDDYDTDSLLGMGFTPFLPNE